MRGTNSYLPPGHPFIRGGQEEYTPVDTQPQGSGHVSSTSHRTARDGKQDFSGMEAVYGADGKEGDVVLLTAGSGAKSNRLNSSWAGGSYDKTGHYVDPDGYMGYTYGGNMASAMAKGAKKIMAVALCLVLVGVIIAVPVAVTTSNWSKPAAPGPSDASSRSIDAPNPTPAQPTPNPTPAPVPVDAPPAPFAPLADGVPEAAKALCVWQDLSLPGPEWISPSQYDLHLKLYKSHFDANNETAAKTVDAEATLYLTANKDVGCVVLGASNTLAIAFVGITIGNNPEVSLDLASLRLPNPESNMIVSLGQNWVRQGQNFKLRFTYAAAIGAGNMQGKVGLVRSDPYDFYPENADCQSQPCTAEDVGGLVQPQQHVLLTLDLMSQKHGARSVMPCLDEPRFKAKFNMIIDAPSDRMARSNGLKSQVNLLPPGPAGEDMLQYRFLTSPPMSPYLLGLAVGHLYAASKDVTIGLNGKNYLVSAWAVPNNSTWVSFDADTNKPTRIQLMQQAAEYARGALSYYSAYTGVPNPIQQFDLIGVPGKTHATEGWGIIMADPDRLVYNPQRESAYGKFRAVSVVCHEMGLQWFGNMVTMESYTDFPLSHGLATWLEYKCIESLEPSMPAYALRTRFTTPLGQPLFAYEGVRMRSDMEFDNPSVAAIEQADAMAQLPWRSAISHSGMAQVVGMMESLSERAQPGLFQDVIKFMLTLNFGSTMSLTGFIQLWAKSMQSHSFGRSSALSSSEWEQVMSRWIAQPGHPFIKAVLPSAGTPNPTKLRKMLQAFETTPHSEPPATTPAPSTGVPKSFSSQLIDRIQVTQKRFCSWGVFQDLGNPDSLFCPGDDRWTWNTTVIVSDLPAMAEQWTGGKRAADGNSTLRIAPATFDPVVVDLTPEVKKTGWVLQAGGFAEVQRVNYDYEHWQDMLAIINEMGVGLDMEAMRIIDGRTPTPEGLAWRSRVFLDAWSTLSDLWAFELSPFTAPLAVPAGEKPLFLQAITAVTTSSAAQSGWGLHMLVMPIIENYERLGARLGPGQCVTDLKNFVSFELREVVKGIARDFIQTYYNSPNITDAKIKNDTNNGKAMSVAWNLADLPVGEKPTINMLKFSPQDHFLYNLTRARIIWSSALIDKEVANFACSLFVDTGRTWQSSETVPRAAYATDITWQAAWEVTGSVQPEGCVVTDDLLPEDLKTTLADGNDNLFGVLEYALGQLKDYADRERLLYAATYTNDNANRLKHLDTIVWGLAGKKDEPTYKVPVRVADATQLILIATRMDQLFGEVDQPNKILQAILTTEHTWPTLAWIYNEGTGRTDGSAALELLEEVVAIAVTEQAEYDSLVSFMDRGAAALSVSEDALNAPKPGTGVSAKNRILGRAKSNLVWKQKAATPLCAWLESNRDKYPPRS